MEHPLTGEHKRLLDDCLRSCPQALELCQALGECGIDTEEKKGILQAQQEMAQKLRDKFFPFTP